MTKRATDFNVNNVDENSPNIPAKQFVSSYEQEKFVNVHSLEELDQKALQIQNKRISEHLLDQKHEIKTLKERIKQFEDRQMKDDELMCIVNRYWNKLDEDGEMLLQRLGCESFEASEKSEYFLKQVASWDKEQLDDKLKDRLLFSKRVISRLVEVIENENTRFEELRLTIIDGNLRDKVSEAIINDLKSLHTENERLKKCCSDLQDERQHLKHGNLDLKDKMENYSMQAEEWKAKFDNMEYCSSESIRDYNRMNRWLTETTEKNKALNEEIFILKGGNFDNEETFDGPSVMAKSKIKELMDELEDSKELAARRLTELEKLEKKYLDVQEEITGFKLQVTDIPENVVLETLQYKSLHAQFNILYTEAVSLQTRLEEAMDTFHTSRQHHLKQIEEMELNESLIQNQMRSDMITTTEQLSKLRADCETLELELKQTLCHNQQSIPIASEMRSLIDTLRMQANQAKIDVQRTRKKYKHLQESYDKMKGENATLDKEVTDMKEKMRIGLLLGKKEISFTEETIVDLHKKLKKLPESDCDKLRKIKKMEETMKEYQHKLALAHQQEDAMINDSSVTIQAYEDVLEQNSRLLQTLKEKDEINLKLMTDRMKANQTEKLLKENQQLLEDQVKMYKTQADAFNSSCAKYEEKVISSLTIMNELDKNNDQERLFLTNLSTLEKESTARQQALEIHKRKAMEYQQTSEDLRMNLQKYLNQLQETKQSLQEKVLLHTKESFKHHRIKEEQLILRRKYDRLKKLEQSCSNDEVLATELQTYKDILTCAACKSNKKDAILTKCFHVFCHSCLKTRYEIRNRKCPKCNATFGANDYHHIYMS